MRRDSVWKLGFAQLRKRLRSLPFASFAIYSRLITTWCVVGYGNSESEQTNKKLQLASTNCVMNCRHHNAAALFFTVIVWCCLLQLTVNVDDDTVVETRDNSIDENE